MTQTKRLMLWPNKNTEEGREKEKEETTLLKFMPSKEHILFLFCNLPIELQWKTNTHKDETMTNADLGAKYMIFCFKKRGNQWDTNIKLKTAHF